MHLCYLATPYGVHPGFAPGYFVLKTNASHEAHVSQKVSAIPNLNFAMARGFEPHLLVPFSAEERRIFLGGGLPHSYAIYCHCYLQPSPETQNSHGMLPLHYSRIVPTGRNRTPSPAHSQL